MTECAVLALNNKMNDGDIQLVDVREYAEFAGGRVAGAQLLP